MFDEQYFVRNDGSSMAYALELQLQNYQNFKEK